MNKQELQALKSKLPHGAGAEISTRSNVARSQVSIFLNGGRVALETETKILQAVAAILIEIKDQREAVKAAAANV